MARNSTEYYRENKRTRRVLHKCTSCPYETTGSKIQLMNHIYARHTVESDRPFQCIHCTRGFAQKAHLYNHMLKKHDINVKKNENTVITIAYLIQLTRKEAKSKKTRARSIFYKHTSCVKGRDIKNNKYEYLPDIYLKLHDIHYDAKQGFITLLKIPLYKGVKITNHLANN